MLKSTFLYLSKSEGFKNFLLHFKSFNRVTRRFVAGEELAEAITAIQNLNRSKIAASFDHLGESITAEIEARNEVEIYRQILQEISRTGIDSNVSVKLTQLGLDISGNLAYENTKAIVASAKGSKNFVRVDMEDSSKTDRTLDVFKNVRSEFDNVGIVIQAYLFRSEKDIDSLLKIGAKVRLCKGAYDEPSSVAFPRKADVDANFIKLMKMLLSSGIYHGIATHDPRMIKATIDYAKEIKLDREKFEFQMLYGVRRDLQQRLVSEGYRTRVYVPYGKYWYPYFMRRLAERPANSWFVLRNMLRG